MTLRSFKGNSPRIAANAYVDETALVIGDVSIGEDSSIWPMVVARGDVNSIHIGAGSNIQDGSVLHVTHDSKYAPGGFALHIGDGVTVGHRVVLHGCRIGDGCLIGMTATVMDGAVVGPRSIVGAGCLVPGGKVLEGGFLYVGSPARQARALTESELESLKYAAQHYARLKEQHRI
jgi:carbonic anhydrase/acetyltransferase-like protein (isoleucine patch superfamily)